MRLREQPVLLLALAALTSACAVGASIGPGEPARSTATTPRPTHNGIATAPKRGDIELVDVEVSKVDIDLGGFVLRDETSANRLVFPTDLCSQPARSSDQARPWRS